MPSLRRTLSSPSVRSSPYGNPSSSANANVRVTRAANPQPRRSSGSDTANRRVLADIDWWLVHDSQRGFAAHHPTGEEDSDDQGAAENVRVRHGVANTLPEHPLPPPSPVADSAPFSAGPAASSFEGDLLSNPLWDVSTDDGSFGLSSPEPLSPFTPFASLSLRPRTPLRRHASVSSQSSVESSPDDAFFTLPTFMDVLRDTSSSPVHPPAFAPSLAPRRPANSRAPALSARSVSYSAVEFRLSTSSFGNDLFGDCVPSPPPFFSTTMEDCEMDDLFY
ncbi:hypothetical protein BC628DRAFT_1332549 [Trametes gibbosa]|nr:hypothetical protein BC628DRAFT_1332549 [Trametes gibbosa]